MPHPVDPWQIVFFAAAGVIVLFHVWRGWRLGVVRQIVSIVALTAALGCAFFGGPLVAPLLRPLGMPDRVLTLAGGALLGVGVFFGVSLISAVIFKKTSQQSLGVIRFAYGAAGALVGAVLGILNVWAFFLGVRLIGSLAPGSATHGGHSNLPVVPEVPMPSWVAGAARIKSALSEGLAGTLGERLDPVPAKVYASLEKTARVAGNEQSVQRFLSFPGVKALAAHPKMAALQNDPELLRDLLAHNYVALLRNEHVVELANDAEIARLLSALEFEKALDYALARPENRGLSPAGR